MAVVWWCCTTCGNQNVLGGALAASTTTTTTSSNNQDKNNNGSTSSNSVVTVRRQDHLDFWDSDTLAYYLDEYRGYDTAVFFYASWDTNSHAIVPYWDQIATYLSAGHVSSNLIMAVFDCEVNHAHATLCQAVGITHYPTMLFIGSGPYYDTDAITRMVSSGLSNSAQQRPPLDYAPIPNTVKFQGQQADAILDWIYTMQGLSRWHLWSNKYGGWWKPWKWILSPFTFWRNKKQQGQENLLPIGIPTTGGITTGTASSSSSLTVANLQDQIKEMKTLLTQYEKALLRNANMLESTLLIPPVNRTFETNNSSSSSSSSSSAPFLVWNDMFTLLHQIDAWNVTSSTTSMSSSSSVSNNDMPLILKSCVVELSLDYCQRTSQQIADTLVDEWRRNDAEGFDNLNEEDLWDYYMPLLENGILSRLQQSEPYCSILDSCLASNFLQENNTQDDNTSNDKNNKNNNKNHTMTCRPTTCPFVNPAACHYVTSCLNNDLQQEYATALGLIMPKEGIQSLIGSVSSSSSSSSSLSSSNQKTSGSGGNTNGKRKGWFH